MSKSLTIAFIVPGSGNTFYCENCLRDCAAVKALRTAGHDVVLVPLYLPLFADEEGLQADAPVFFGGINVYLQQKIPLFRKTPRWVDRLLDSRSLLGMAAEKAAATRPQGMGAMTLSMLRGTDGNQAKEVRRLVEWLEQLRPDIVHFSNALLIGMVPDIRRAMPQTRIVCSLQDEDTWLDGLDAPFGQQCVEAISRLLAQCDGVIAVSRTYARDMGRRLNLPSGKVRVIPPGLETQHYPPLKPAASPKRVGYLSRVSEGLGAGLLAQAYLEVIKDAAFSDLELVFGGGSSGDDSAFIEKLKDQFAEAGCMNRIHFLPGLKLEERLDLISRLTVMCVPMPRGEAFGTFIVESLMCGIPVVQPDVGGFGEILRNTRGGLLYDVRRQEEPVRSLVRILSEPGLAEELGEQGRKNAVKLYSSTREARDLAELYGQLTADTHTDD